MGFLTDLAINAVCEAMVNNETEQDNQQRCEDILQYAQDGTVSHTLVLDATTIALIIGIVPIIIFIGGMVVGFYLAREYLFARRSRKK